MGHGMLRKEEVAPSGSDQRQGQSSIESIYECTLRQCVMHCASACRRFSQNGTNGLLRRFTDYIDGYVACDTVLESSSALELRGDCEPNRIDCPSSTASVMSEPSEISHVSTVSLGCLIYISIEADDIAWSSAHVAVAPLDKRHEELSVL